MKDVAVRWPKQTSVARERGWRPSKAFRGSLPRPPGAYSAQSEGGSVMSEGRPCADDFGIASPGNRQLLKNIRQRRAAALPPMRKAGCRELLAGHSASERKCCCFIGWRGAAGSLGVALDMLRNCWFCYSRQKNRIWITSALLFFYMSFTHHLSKKNNRINRLNFTVLSGRKMHSKSSSCLITCRMWFTMPHGLPSVAGNETRPSGPDIQWMINIIKR